MPTPVSALTPVPTHPLPLPLPPTPTPTATSIPPTATHTSPTQPEERSGQTFQIKIREIAADLPDYLREDWTHWIDANGDCQNTRHEVLIEESLKEATFKGDRHCQVATGEWFAPYTRTVVTDATKLDVDHMVPLKNTHDSGGWAWDKDKKAVYANEIGYEGHLIAVTASANRTKVAKGPEEWKPANQDYWCDYAVSWVQIKVEWELSATKAEWTALQEMFKMCDSFPSITADLSKAESSPTETPVAPSATVTSGSSNIQIAAMDCKSKPEIVVVANAGALPQSMTGWKVKDQGAKNTFNFPAEFSLEPGSSVKLISGQSGNDTGQAIYWNNRTVWNNDGDTASLFDPSSQLASQMKCP